MSADASVAANPAVSRHARRRILVVEDDESTQEFYRHFFEVEHRDIFTWELAASAERALGLLRAKPFDALILDWSLPRMQGLEFLDALKKDPVLFGLPVFMITSHTNVDDCVRALEAGCDAFLAKPFEPAELHAKLSSLFSRGGLRAGFLRLEDLELDQATGRAAVGGRPANLYAREAALLAVFLKHPDVVHSTAFLWDAAWGAASAGRDMVLAATVASLRQKLGPKWGGRFLAEGGRGYRLALR